MRIMSVLTHSVQALAEGSLIALIVVGLLAGTASAGKPSASGKPSAGGGLAGPLMVSDANGNGASNYMDSITFNLSTSADQPYVGVRCWQGTNFIYDGYVGYFRGAWFDPYFTLGSTYWDPALSAACTARLFYHDNRGRERVLATLDFGVAP